MSLNSNLDQDNVIVCQLCFSSENDMNFYGQINVSKDYAVHNFCCLFACGLYQNGDINDEMQGFIIEDIRKEILRAKKLRCSFCKKMGASIGCCITNCKVKYHYSCGLKTNIFFEYFDEHKSYCKKHKPKQKSDLFTLFDITNNICEICFCNFVIEDMDSIIGTPCCKNCFFHKICIQNYALSSGAHYFKCPRCNDKEIFRQEMLHCGIALPDRDAQWEQETTYFRNQENLRYICDVKECKSNQSRSENLLDTEWEIMRCDDCGYNGTHLFCSNLKSPMDPWICHECASVNLNNELIVNQSTVDITLKQPVSLIEINTSSKSSNPNRFVISSDQQKNISSVAKKKQVDIRSYLLDINTKSPATNNHLDTINQKIKPKINEIIMNNDKNLTSRKDSLFQCQMTSVRSLLFNKNAYSLFQYNSSGKLYKDKSYLKYNNFKNISSNNIKKRYVFKTKKGIIKKNQLKENDILLKFALLTGDIKLLPSTKIFCVL